MAQVFADGARDRLTSPITASDDAFNLEDGSMFPALNEYGMWFKAVLQDESGFEIVYVTGHTIGSPTLFDVVRGQEGTTARSFAAGTVIGNRLTAADMADLHANKLSVGQYGFGAVPAGAYIEEDCDSPSIGVRNGFFYVDATTTNTPVPTAAAVLQTAAEGGFTNIHQTCFSIYGLVSRSKAGSNPWSAWGYIFTTDSGVPSENVNGLPALLEEKLNRTGGELSGDLEFYGPGLRIRGDFSSATVADRLMFQSNSTNSNTVVQALPSGTASASYFGLLNNSDATNGNRLVFGMSATAATVESQKQGTGSYLPLELYSGGIKALAIDTSGVAAFSQRSSHAGAYTPSVESAHSATPTFDCAASNAFEPGPMTSNITSMTLDHAVAGQTVSIRLKQDGFGNRSVAVPSGAKVDGSPALGANRVTLLVMTYSGRDSRWEGAFTQVPA